MGRAKPDVRPPGAAIPSAKSIYVVEIPLAGSRDNEVSSNNMGELRHSQSAISR